MLNFSSVFSSKRIVVLYLTLQLLAKGTSVVLGQPPSCNNNTSCLYEYMPVCGSDGNTYANLCFLFVASCRVRNLTYARHGPCQIPDPCNIPCNRRYYPVCGNDGVTYSNPCVLMYSSCVYIGRGITRAYFGRCNTTTTTTTPLPRPTPPPTRPTNIPCPFGCTREYLPICGSDGVTYSNQCTLDSVTCTNPSVVKVSDGACGGRPIRPPTTPSCPLGCNRVYEPVCASNGVTYTNTCELTKASCTDSSITKVKDGPCNPQPRPGTQGPFNPQGQPSGGQTPSGVLPPITPNREFCRKDCPFTYTPLCGTDGVTYSNKCTFDVGVCVDSSLKVDYNGGCV